MKYFKLEELVDRETFETQGEKAWSLFNPIALIALDNLREYFGVSIMINNWAKGGTMQWRGYRSPQCPIGAVHSQHRKGNAFDCSISKHDAGMARAIILAYQENELLRNITRLEDKVSWVHFDCAPLPEGKKRIYLFQP